MLEETGTAGRRVDWWSVLLQLHKQGLSLQAVSIKTGIPKSTLMGFKNHDAEPRHCDGVCLVALWRSVMYPPLPTQDTKPRSRRAEK